MGARTVGEPPRPPHDSGRPDPARCPVAEETVPEAGMDAVPTAGRHASRRSAGTPGTVFRWWAQR